MRRITGKAPHCWLWAPECAEYPKRRAARHSPKVVPATATHSRLRGESSCRWPEEEEAHRCSQEKAHRCSQEEAAAAASSRPLGREQCHSQEEAATAAASSRPRGNEPCHSQEEAAVAAASSRPRDWGE
jgi:hypothetical protein